MKKLIDIGDVVTAERAIELCCCFGLFHLARRIRFDPGSYKDWKFDGCSGLPDRILGWLSIGWNWEIITYFCCLPHDLSYAYGRRGDEVERKRADLKFRDDLIAKANMNRWYASVFYRIVRIGGIGKFGLSFSWGFANKD